MQFFFAQIKPIALPRSVNGRFLVGLVFALLVLLSACSMEAGQTASPSGGAVAESPTPFVFPPTFTPTKPGPPTLTRTPRPSSTPINTLTPAPTLAPSATPPVNIVFASDQDQPLISQSLLFFEQGVVQLWDRNSGLVEPLNADLAENKFDMYSTSAGGGMIALSRQLSPEEAEILVFNRLAGTISGVLSVSTAGILDLEISPDGSWLAYVAAEYEPGPTNAPTNTPQPTFTPTIEGQIHPTPSPTPTLAPTPVFEIPTGGPIFTIRTDSLANPARIGECGRNCSGLFWAPGSNSFVWGDPQGLWEASPGSGGSPPGQVLEPFLSGIAGSTQSTDSYFPISWSPTGRYILLRKGLRQGVIFAVVDTSTGMLENVPGTGVYSGPSAGYAWLANGLFFIARPGVESEALLPAGELWELSPSSADSMFLSRGEFAFPGDIYTIASSPAQLPDGRLGLSLVNFRDQNDVETNGVYIMDPVGGEIVKINLLPFARVEDMQWLADGSGVLVKTGSRILFVPAFSDPIYSLSNFLGRESCCFDWID